MMKVAVFSVAAALAVCVLVFVGSSAQTSRRPTQLPPLPVNEKGFPASLAPVVGAEHAFAQRSIDEGMKPAFLAYAAPDGVVVNRQGPVNAIETWSRRDPAPAGLLTWWPTYADVSRAGDMGWTTGPFEFREKPTQEKPDDTGHFFTVWRRQPDGFWKWVLDLGIRHPAPEVTETALSYPASLKKSLKPAAADVDASRRSLVDAERTLSEASASVGFRTALLARADDSLRLYRQGTFPLVGKESVAKAVKVLSEYITWKPLKADVSASGDLGYAYGSYELRTNKSDEKPAELGHYARVWKRDPKGPWRVVFNVANPAQ
ncbi:MAG: nuclear transport factor 2 family protein [Acidobacteria bacterium]|nr:nuclear transport factor 2 family protein [Acidobacteriota bacterium]